MDGLTQRKEECRDMRRVNLIENTLQDVRYALRVLAKSPGFTAVAVLTLALAIGANSVVFGVLNALILRPMDVPQAESLYAIQRKADHYGAESYPNYVDLRDRNRSFEAWRRTPSTAAGLDTGDSPSRVWLEPGKRELLRRAAAFSRISAASSSASDEHGPNSAPYIVLSYGYWRTHFQDDPGVVGRVVRRQQAPLHHHRRRAARVSRDPAVLLSRFLRADGEPGAGDWLGLS